MNLPETVKSLLKAAGLSDDQVSAVEKEIPASESGVAAPAHDLSLSPEEIAALTNNKPDPNAPENPSTIAPTKPPTIEELQVEVLALKARFERLVFENFNKDKGY